MLFSTLNVAYDQIITSTVDSALNHIKLADELNSQVVEVLKGVERKNEEAKKKVSRLLLLSI
jgi:formin-binding protein 1